MNEMTTFTSDKERLEEILAHVSKGLTQLPEFQRGWIWDDSHIRSLLASVSLSFPIGAVMMLESGNPDVRFKPLLVEAVELDDPPEPERFILDGQQRLTSLYQSLFLKRPVTTKDPRGKNIKRWYYIDMNKALDPNEDREEAIIGLPEDRVIRNFRNEILHDYSSPESEFEHNMFPLSQVFNCSDWRRDYAKHWNYDRNRMQLFDEFERQVVKRFEQYLIPIIKILKQSPKIAVCLVFEKVNTGGVSLTVFELLTATFAAEGYNLREDWEGERNKRNQKIGHGRKDKLGKHAVLEGLAATDFLQTVSLLATYGRRQAAEREGATPFPAVSCKRQDVLKLELADYKKWADLATEGYSKSARFLFQQKLFTARDIPYGTQLVPLATIFTLLGDSANSDAVRQKITRWYWCGVFGELYGSAVETRFARDVVEVLQWIDGGEEPSTVKESSFLAERLYTLRTRRSAAYKGLYAMLMRDGGQDFITGEEIVSQNYFDDSIDIHHIFPSDYCKKKGIEAQRYDSVINKTAISAKTNRTIGGKAPSEYLRLLRAKDDMPQERQDEILRSHIIDPITLAADDFEAFIETRREALLTRIENLTGKPITRDQTDNTSDDDDNEVIEMEVEEAVS